MPQLFNLLEHVYGVVNKETAYEAKFNELVQEHSVRRFRGRILPIGGPTRDD